LTRYVEIRTASVGVSCYASSALVLERLSPKRFRPFAHDVKTPSRAIRFQKPFRAPLRKDASPIGPNPNETLGASSQSRSCRGGLLSLEEACSRYSLNVDEFGSWQESIDRYGFGARYARRVSDGIVLDIGVERGGKK
jgi:hypothetical protein